MIGKRLVDPTRYAHKMKFGSYRRTFPQIYGGDKDSLRSRKNSTCHLSDKNADLPTEYLADRLYCAVTLHQLMIVARKLYPGMTIKITIMSRSTNRLQNPNVTIVLNT